MKNKQNILIGEVFNRLTILSEVEPKTYPSGQSKRRMLCKCECGKETIAELGSLKNGGKKSCGCIRRDIARKRIKRGTTETIRKYSNGKLKPEYVSWYNMKKRCYNPTYYNYQRYKEKGIIVCDRWLNSFDNFLEDMGPKPGPEYSIDRINNSGNYEPSNCRWATRSEQQLNKDPYRKKS